MLNWSTVAVKLIGSLISVTNSTNLRNRMYQLYEHREILLTALEDIQRMDHSGVGGRHAQKILDLMDQKHGVKLGQLDKKISK
jgi:hypothetical protein